MKFTPSQLEPLLKIAVINKSVPFVLGAPGIGKSAVMRSITQDLDTKLFVVSANLLSDKADVTGVMKTTLPNGEVAQSFYPHQTIQEAINYAKDNPDKLTLLFLDEVNRAPEDVQTSLMSLSTERRIGNVDLPDNISIILAGNDSGNVNAVDSATISRSVLYRMVPNAADLLASPAGKNFDPDVIAWLKSNPDNVFAQPLEDESDDDNNGSDVFNEMGEDFNQFTTPRTIEKFSDFLKSAKSAGIWDTLIKDFDAVKAGAVQEDKSPLYGVVYAHLGRTAAANRFLDRIGAKVGNSSVSLKPIPDSVKNIITLDDIPAMIDNLRDQFINDDVLAQRLLDGLLFRGIPGVIEDFKININAYQALIDLIFETFPGAQPQAISQASSIGKISQMANSAITQSTNPQVIALNSIFSSLIAGGNITVED